MNFSQMHESLRLLVLRRIEQGMLSASWLARRADFGQAHISNFLGEKRKLSLQGLDRVLGALSLTVDDLRESGEFPVASKPAGRNLGVPLVAHNTAMFAHTVGKGAVQGLLSVPEGRLAGMRISPSSGRQEWQRFVAVAITGTEAVGMDPIVGRDALLIIDRHYTGPAEYQPGRRTIYAVRHEQDLRVGYVEFRRGLLILRPHSLMADVKLVLPGAGRSPRDLITGRVVMVMNEV